MNKMGLCQRLWCLMVTVVLILTAAGGYPDKGTGYAQARGTADIAGRLNSGTIKADDFQNRQGSSFFTSISGNVQPEVQTTGRAIVYSQEAFFTGASQLGGTSRLKPAATEAPEVPEAPQATAAPADKKPDTAVKQPASVPVAAPAPEQIITSMKVTATGYTAGYESTGKTSKHPQYGITYSGVKVRRDKNAVSTIAADPKVLPLGSILYIPGYGYAIVADTGSAIKGRKIDLYFATTKQVYKEWGKKTVVVQLIKRGNGKCTESMLKDLGKAIETYKTIPQDLLEESI
ncbi:3D (Asp-Asp-Asp) domain-containing protein [Paenibacillus typhae]|uniref:3D (Asp-Asp-Asp) domain-containing protein n=1 Tax=Paenibacillus typhae TaxID=1174501 RepID=A0A1G8MLM8_9BACL|nr:3D (Asp-Asp-Asp) domain-containing protein [Paenibacillus typhae]